MNDNFDLCSNDFTLLSVDIKKSDTGYYLGICCIDSYNKSIKISQILETPYFTNLESVFQQLLPLHEDIPYYLLCNCPNDSILQNLKNKITSFGKFSKIIIESNMQQLKEKITGDLFKINGYLFKEEDTNLYKKSFAQNDVIFPLEVLEHTVNFINILNVDELNRCFKLEKLNSLSFMNLDMSCIKCLNLFDDDNDKNILLSNLKGVKKGINNYTSQKTSLYSVLNKCCTKFGSRILRSWILQPLQDINIINQRLNLVEGLISRPSFNINLRKTYLSKIDDIQTINLKLANYISSNINKNAKKTNKITLEDCAKIQRTISVNKDLYSFIKLFDGNNQSVFLDVFVRPLAELLQYLGKLEELIYRTIRWDKIQKEYKIDPNFNEKLAKIQELIEEDYNQIELIRNEVENDINKGNKKAIKKVNIQEYLTSGFCLEMNKSVGQEFLSANANFKLVISNKNKIIITNNEIKNYSKAIKENKKAYKELEEQYILKILNVISTYHPILDKLTILLSTLDIISSFASLVLNSKFPYCKPKMGAKNTPLALTQSRHILLEHLSVNNANSKIEIVSNDLKMTPGEDNIHLLTGINMGGKSTYLRQIGLCVIMAHIGSYVPATEASIPIIDQIFTRVGAGDIMLKGVSTYMNEMIEVCSLLKAAKDSSLLLIDELGRGTSTEDGIAISGAIIKFISSKLTSYCLFATHFYEVTKLEDMLKNVKNYFVSHSLIKEQIVMMYKVLRGKTDTSLGVGLFSALNFDKDALELLDKFSKS